MNRDFLEMIKTRRSTRSFKPDSVPEDLLDAVLEAGTYAPTGMNRQSPVIIAVSDKKYREKLSKLNAAIMGVDKDPYYGAPTVVLVLADPSANTFVEDGSCVLENLMLAAHACDLGSVWVHREREIFDSEEGKKLLREWNLPETLRGVGSIALGYPAADVDGFMRLGADRAKCVGIWCVYGDEDAAKKTFSAYRKCKKVYADVYRRNRSFDQLVVSRSYN